MSAAAQPLSASSFSPASLAVAHAGAARQTTLATATPSRGAVDTAACPLDVQALVQQMLDADRAQVGHCRLLRNRGSDCVLGIDACDTEAVVGFSADVRGCREAVLWALRAGMAAPPQRLV